MLGSFFIGLVASSSTLGISSDKPLAALPPQHPWQDNFALQLGKFVLLYHMRTATRCCRVELCCCRAHTCLPVVSAPPKRTFGVSQIFLHNSHHLSKCHSGIRTGYCGCLTTFSSWMLEIWTRAMQDNAWVEAFLALILGLQAALVSFVLGGHVALYCDRWWLSEKEDVLKEEGRYRSAEMAEYRHEAMSIEDEAALHGPREASLRAIEGDLPRLIPPQMIERQSWQEESNGKTRRHLEPSARRIENGGEEAAPTTMLVQEGRKEGGSIHGPNTETKGALVSHQSGQAVQHEIQQKKHHLLKQQLHRLPITDSIASLGLIALVVGAAFGVAFETRHTWLRTAWLAVLFGPFGCLLRWKLSFYNYKLKGRWVWLPAGTLAANLLGTAVIFAVEATLVKTNAGYWGDLVMKAVQMGFCGALSTVSTLVMELVKLSDVFPDSGQAYVYSTLTFVGGSVLAFVVFGWAAWS
jgi:fluoride exporter